MSAAKRKRVDEGPDEATTTRSEIWFTDGNIILEAETTQFRVHRGVLAKHSSVFKDMFDVPQPPGEPEIEGCPIVHLSDTAQDVGHLLNRLYDCFYNPHDALPIPVISAMVRLGHKYNFLRFRDDAVSRLMHDFPQDLVAFTKRRGYTRIRATTELLDLLILVRDLKLHRILPTLYLDLISKYDLKKIFVGVPRPDKSLIHLSNEEKLVWAFAAYRAREADMEHTFQWLKRVPYKNCTSRKCEPHAKCIYFVLFADNSGPAGFFRGVQNWDMLWTDKFCNHCTCSAMRDHREGQAKLWEALPSFFGLPPWPALKNFD